jgi:hypothetical protein
MFGGYRPPWRLFFTTNEMYTIQSGESFEQWVKLIRERGNSGFTFVTMNPWFPVPTGDPAVQVVPVNQEIIAGLRFMYLELRSPP